MAMPSLASLIAKAGLTRLSPGLEAQARLTVFMKTRQASMKSLKLGESRIGGDPDLPENLAWPDREGRPLAFLAQLRLEDLTASAPKGLLPPRGHLCFFYDAEKSPWGFDPKDRGGAKVVYVTEPKLVRKEAPRSLDASGRFSSNAVSFEGGQSLPSCLSDYVRGLELSKKEFDAYQNLESRLSGDSVPGAGCHRLFGRPDQVQEDMEEECQLASNGIYCGGSPDSEDPKIAALLPGSKDWRLLLQIDSDEPAGMMWGDLGMLYF